jgi:hypothetical protein
MKFDETRCKLYIFIMNYCSVLEASGFKYRPLNPVYLLWYSVSLVNFYIDRTGYPINEHPHHQFNCMICGPHNEVLRDDIIGLEQTIQHDCLIIKT